MDFQSILFNHSEYRLDKNATADPACFVDLNLNQIVDSLVKGKEEYNLRPYLQNPLHDVDTIVFRQKVMTDLENPKAFRYVQAFAESMRSLRNQMSFIDRQEYKYHKERLFVDAVIFYHEFLQQFYQNLSNIDLKSEGLIDFKNYLMRFVQSAEVEKKLAEAHEITVKLSSIKYCINIDGLQVHVLKYANETDYTIEVEKTFAKFKQGNVKDYKVGIPFSLNMNHVEASILDGVVTLYPEIFARLDRYYESNLNFQDSVITVFDREIQFYVTYLSYIESVRDAGLKFCYPTILPSSKQVACTECFDLALANTLVQSKTQVVVNDFYLEGKERIIVVSGPNQGGKTTFSRTFGQLHYLASLGYPVPASTAQVLLFDNIFTHFEKEEDIVNLRGKLQDDLIRIHEILESATGQSIIFLNELFASTTLQDAILLSKEVLNRIIELDALCVWVTFIDELASYSEQTVSMVGSVLDGNPTLRSFKIQRKPADGLAYAITVAERYHLTYSSLKERLKV